MVGGDLLLDAVPVAPLLEACGARRSRRRPPCPWRRRCSAHDMPRIELSRDLARPGARTAAGRGLGGRRGGRRRRQPSTGVGSTASSVDVGGSAVGFGRLRRPASGLRPPTLLASDESAGGVRRLEVVPGGDAAGRWRTSPSRPSSTGRSWHAPARRRRTSVRATAPTTRCLGSASQRPAEGLVRGGLRRV